VVVDLNLNIPAGICAAKMSVKAYELVPAIERINLLSEKVSTQVCH